jgi:hypothetical protein
MTTCPLRSVTTKSYVANRQAESQRARSRAHPDHRGAPAVEAIGDRQIRSWRTVK